jgi:MFS transporter, PAT family, beta-lactamase induction signal transducer AmpG
MAQAAADASSAAKARAKYGWRDVLASFHEPRVLAMLALGFSAGLPFLLTGNTLGAWLRDEGTELAAIGFISWVGLAYSLKFVWAPLLDRVELPVLGRLGKRRSWIVLAQIGVVAGLAAMTLVGPQEGLVVFGAFAVVVAFASATQDIAIDAWRIESSRNAEELGLMSAAYQLGYRTAQLITNALIFNLAARTGWEFSYALMAVLMGVGFAAALYAAEPTASDSFVAGAVRASPATPVWTLRGVYDAIVGPFIAFFSAHGTKALLLLAAISLYRLPDFVMGPMVNPFYRDLGLSLDAIGAMRASVGLWGTLAGIAAGGFCAVRLGFVRTLVLGAFLCPASNLGLATMAFLGQPDLGVFGGALALENFSEAFAGTALIAWMSSLTTFGYVATQYALLSSFYAILGKVLKGLSGVAVETLDRSFDLTFAYGMFFSITASMGLLSVVVVIWTARVHSPTRR